MAEGSDPLAAHVRVSLRKIGCYFLFSKGEEAVTRDVDFGLKRSPDKKQVFVVIPRDGLPYYFGYSAFQRQRCDLAKYLHSAVDLQLSNGKVVITFSPNGTNSQTRKVMHQLRGNHRERVLN